MAGAAEIRRKEESMSKRVRLIKAVSDCHDIVDAGYRAPIIY